MSIIYKALKRVEQLPDTEVIVFQEKSTDSRQKQGLKWLVIGVFMVFLWESKDVVYHRLASFLTHSKLEPTADKAMPPEVQRRYQSLVFKIPESVEDDTPDSTTTTKPVTSVMPETAYQKKLASKKPVKPIVKKVSAPVIKIELLVQQLYTAMATNQVSQVNHLLAQLSQQMGSQSGFVVKLKAYWLLTQKRYSQVEGLLQAYLLQQPKDLEAGINLSIAEMQRDRVAALSRLQQLNLWYPDNQTVRDLLAQLSK